MRAAERLDDTWHAADAALRTYVPRPTRPT